jgi:hypothetical protein
LDLRKNSRNSIGLSYVTKNMVYPLRRKLPVLYSYKVDFFFLSLLLLLSIIFFKDILTDDFILVHGDFKYALTVDEHVFHHLNNLPIHAAKLPLLSILYPLKTIFGDNAAEKVFTILVLFLAATFVYFANKLFVGRFEGARGYWLSSCCFIGSLVFVYNPWTIGKIHHHYWLVLSLAASYLLLATIDDYLRSRERKGRKQLLIVAFLTSLVATQFASIINYFMPMLIIYLIINLVLNRSAIVSKLAIKKIAFLAIVTLACNLFWVFPVIEVLAADRISQGFGFVTYEISEGLATYGIVDENVDQLSRRATIHNVLQGTGDWVWGQGSSPDPSIIINNIDLWERVALLPLIFVVLFFIIPRPIGKGMIYITVFFSALVILSVILATGSYYNNIYKRVFLDFPLGESLRDPYKFSGLYFVAISFFASASLYKLERKSMGKNIAIFLLFVGLILSWGWVGLTGNLNGHLTQSLLPYPNDLSDVTEFLHRQYQISSSANGSIFWYPTGTGRAELQYSSVPELSTESLPQLRLPPFQLNYIDSLITKNDTSFIPLLEYLGAQYLVIREDYLGNDDNVNPDNVTPEPLQEVRMQVQNLKTILQENKVFESGRFGVYKLNPSSSVSVSHAITVGTDDLSKIAKVAGESDYLNNNIQLGPFLENSFIISDLPPPELLESGTIIVDPTSEHFSPRNYWSSGAINGGWLNTITPYLNSSGINTWQFDYNKGSIFSLEDTSNKMIENSISVPYKVENTNQYKVFVRYLESPPGGLIDINLEGSMIKISTLSTDSKFVWKDLGEYTLNQGSHNMIFTNERGFNAINAILLIPIDQFEVTKGQIQDWLNRNNTITMQVFEAESDMNMDKTTIVDKISSSGSDQIALVNGTVWKQFDVKKEGDYSIWIKGSGLFSVVIDGHKEIVNATMNKPTFSDTFRLKEGESRLEITPLQNIEKLKISDQQSNYLAGNTSNGKASGKTNVIDSIWLVSDSNHLQELLDDGTAIISPNQMQVTTTTTMSNNLWSSQKYEIKLNNISTTTKPLMISVAEPFNPDLKAAIYTKDGGLSKVENLIPLFYSLKSGIYLDSLPTDAKIVIYNDAGVPIGWLFVISSFVSLASYVLIVLSANVNLTNRFKGFLYNLNPQLLKQKKSKKE